MTSEHGEGVRQWADPHTFLVPVPDHLAESLSTRDCHATFAALLLQHHFLKQGAASALLLQHHFLKLGFAIH